MGDHSRNRGNDHQWRRLHADFGWDFQYHRGERQLYRDHGGDGHGKLIGAQRPGAAGDWIERHRQFERIDPLNGYDDFNRHNAGER